MAISRDELIKKIGDWHKGNKVDGLLDSYLEYLDSILEKNGYNAFVTDPDTGEELDDYTPEFETTQAEVLNDLGLSDNEIEMIMNTDNPVTSKTIIDKDDDGDADVTITKQDDGNDKKSESDEPHDEGLATSGVLAGDLTPEEIKMIQMMRAKKQAPKSKGLAGDTTLEEDLMLNPDMSPSEFSKKAAEKRGAKPGEPAPDFNNFTNDIARNLASRRW